MNWVAIRPVLKAAVQAATGVDVRSIIWKGTKEEAGWSQGGTVVKLSTSGERTVGCDEERRAKYDAGTNTRTLTLSGHRQFSFTVRIECQDESDTAVRDTLASRLRTRIWRDSITSTLRAVNVSIADIRPTVPVDNVRLQNRMLSVAVVEFLMNGVENDVDDTPGAADWIAEVHGTGTLTREDGTTFTVPTDTKRVTP